MNQYVTGTMIKSLREKCKLTQLQLADRLGVSDKTVSKWETGKGYPDITLLEPIADALSVSVAELLSGNTVCNSNVSANVMRSRFYICPVCGNIIHSMGEAVVHCHGVLLQPSEAEETDEFYKIFVDSIQMFKLYPEGNVEARVKRNGVKRIYFYCNRSGLFFIDLVKGIDDKESGYDDSGERRKLEEAARMLFG